MGETAIFSLLALSSAVVVTRYNSSALDMIRYVMVYPYDFSDGNEGSYFSLKFCLILFIFLSFRFVIRFVYRNDRSVLACIRRRIHLIMWVVMRVLTSL